jgi:hypothetical protein
MMIRQMWIPARMLLTHLTPAQIPAWIRLGITAGHRSEVDFPRVWRRACNEVNRLAEFLHHFARDFLHHFACDFLLHTAAPV